MGFSHSSETVSVVARGNEGGGAALDQVIGMSVVALVVTAGLLWIGYLHRQRRITWLNNLAEWAGRKFKRPPWVALPMALFIATLICALSACLCFRSNSISAYRNSTRCSSRC
jgi:hypothetical protein